MHATFGVEERSSQGSAGRNFAPRGGGGARGWQQGCEQPTGHGAVHVVWRCEILVRGGRRVGQEGVCDMGT